jgi:hypothetical protein
MSEPHPALVLKTVLFVQYIIFRVLFFSETYDAQAGQTGIDLLRPQIVDGQILDVFDWRTPNNTSE